MGGLFIFVVLCDARWHRRHHRQLAAAAGARGSLEQIVQDADALARRPAARVPASAAEAARSRKSERQVVRTRHGQASRNRGLTTAGRGLHDPQQARFQHRGERAARRCSGPNGAGKTTLIAMITGQFRPTAGKIYFDGEDITGMAPERIFQRASAGSSRCRTCTRRCRFTTTSWSRSRATARCSVPVAAGDAAESGAHLGASSSSSSLDGQGRRSRRHALAWRAAVARARHADRIQSQAAAARRADHRHDRGRASSGPPNSSSGSRRDHTVLLVEHDMHIVRQIANRVTVLHQGQVLAEGPLARWSRTRRCARSISARDRFSDAAALEASTPTTAPATSCTACRSRSATAS